MFASERLIRKDQAAVYSAYIVRQAQDQQATVRVRFMQLNLKHQPSEVLTCDIPKLLRKLI